MESRSAFGLAGFRIYGPSKTANLLILPSIDYSYFARHILITVYETVVYFLPYVKPYHSLSVQFR